MMFEILIVGALNLVAVSFVGHRLTRRIDRVSEQVDQSALEIKSTTVNESERVQRDNYWIGRLNRLYIGKMLLEDRVLPALGIDGHTQFEQRVDSAWTRVAGKPR